MGTWPVIWSFGKGNSNRDLPTLLLGQQETWYSSVTEYRDNNCQVFPATSRHVGTWLGVFLC